LLHVDFNNEIFVKLDKNNNPLVWKKKKKSSCF
jgi:hypothetical protein